MSSEVHDTGKEVDGTQVDKINTGALGTLVAVGLLAMLSITAAVTALVRHDMEVEESEKNSDSNAVVIGLKNSQRGMLNGPAGYVDRAKGLVSLPIDLAKGLVVGELQKDPNSATPAPKATAAAEATDSGAAAVTSPEAGAKPEAGAQPEPGKQAEPAKDKATEAKPAEGKPAPVGSAKPAPAILPKPTPTAATPGAESPGPVNH